MKKQKTIGLRKMDAISFYAFTSPWLIGFLVLTVYPMITSLYMTFTDSGFSGDGKFIGLQNYINAFTVDALFIKTFWNSICYVLMFVPLSLILAFILGWLLSRSISGLSFFRTVFYLPYITAGVAVTILWGWIFNGSYGLLNYILSLIGIQGPNWLGDKHIALFCIVLMNLWTIGNSVIIMLAGIQDIPAAYYESARIDGASTFRQIFSITIPLSTPIIYFNLVVNIISSFQLFDQPYILTSGGPVDSTCTASLLLFRNAFQYGKMGYGSCIAWCLFVLIMVITLLLQKTSKRWVYYEG
jgi:multiple sugar transport system permease protein